MLGLGTIADRYRVEAFAGAGGMGHVYRAIDTTSDRAVAVKVLLRLDDGAAKRFEHEASVLAELVHPGVVEYIDHGTTSDGLAYIVMEWLDGMELSRRLASGPLDPHEAVAVAASVAGTLGFAHARGIVHRDVKPGNLIAVGGDARRVKLVDFGLARIHGGLRFTQTGVGMGTPAYAAPEQARGESELGPSADVFSLGCVLFECLTGRPPFVAEHVVALLARILFEEPPRLGELMDDAPPELEELVAAMLAKDPAARPADGHAVALELGPIAMALGPKRTKGRAERTLAPGRELRSVAVVVAGGLADISMGDTTPLEARAGTVAIRTTDGEREVLEMLAAEHGARLGVLSGGSAVLLFSDPAPAKDLAATAARCALAVQRLLPNIRLGVAMDQAPGDTAPVALGPVFDRAADLLHGEPMSLTPSLRAHAIQAKPILVDELAAGLLDVGFLIAGRGPPRMLVGERPVEEHRTLLGRRTTCVGRDAELSTLEALLEACIEGPAARVAIVTGPAGVGKSRLRVELMRRVRERNEGVRMWLACAEPMGRPASFGLIAQVVLRLASVTSGDDTASRRRKLRALLARDVPPLDLPRLVEFLGELVARAPGEEASVQLRAARDSPALMRDQIERAWVDYVRAVAAREPVLLVLEDVHWADPASMRLVEATRRQLTDHPLCVVATARPTGLDAVPRTWMEEAAVRLAVPGLGKKAIAELCRQVLGDAATTMVDRIVTGSGGNALHVEELIRAAATLDEGAAPRTVVAMLQARFDALDTGGRLVLRASSVLGERFTAAGICALVGDAMHAEDVERHAEALRNLEIVDRADAEGGAAGGRAWAFRHALIQEAAYDTLTSDDRMLAHRLAARWLMRMGEGSAVRVAEHFERGAEPERALPWYVRGAERALDAHDLSSAIHCVERGVSCGASGETLGMLKAVHAEAAQWQDDTEAGARLGEEAMAHLAPGSSWWCRATVPVLGGALAGGKPPPTALIDELVKIPIRPADQGTGPSDEDAARALVVARTAAYVVLAEWADLAEPLFERLRALDLGALGAHPQAAGWVGCALSLRAVIVGDPLAALEYSETSEAAFLSAGNVRDACWAQTNNASFLQQLGAWERSVTVAADLEATATRMNLSLILPYARGSLGLARARLGDAEEGARLLEASIEGARASKDRRYEGNALCYRAWVAEASGRAADAERFARLAVDVLSGARLRCLALATLARALLLGRGDPERDRAALRLAREGFEAMLALGGTDEGESLIRLTAVEATLRVEGRAAAVDALASAAARIRERAAGIAEAGYRRSFLERVPENARTLALAAELGADTTR